MRGKKHQWAILAAVGGVLFGTSARGAINASWLAPADGSWTDPTAWSTNPAYPNMDQPDPGDLYNAIIGASGATPYTVSLDTDITISQLSINSSAATLNQTAGTLRLVDGGLSVSAGLYVMDGGTLLSDDPMTIGSNFVWNGGAIGGFGAVNLTSTSVTNVGKAQHTLSTTLNNAGVINIAATPIQLNNGTLNNATGATMNLSGSTPFTSGSGSNLVSNNGIMNVFGLSTTTITVPFQDFGTIALNGGTLLFNNSSTTFGAGAAITGFGTADLGFGTTTLAGKLTLTAANVALSGGTITGSGDLQINDLLTWNSGTMSGTGVTNVAHGAAISFGSSFSTRGLSRTLNNAGVINISAGQFSITNGALNNLANGVINISGSASQPLGSNSGSTSLVTNAGIININTSQTLVTLPPMIDSGTINVIAGGATFGFGTYTYDTGAIFTGPGTIDLSNGTHIVNGTLTLAGSNMRISSGTIIGSGNIILTNTFNWIGGTIGTGNSGTSGVVGSMNVLPGAVLTIGSFGSSRTLGRVLNNSGVINMLSSGGTLGFSNGTLNNLAGGTLNIFSTTPFPFNSGTLSLIHNSGVINVDSGTGLVGLGGTMTFLNSGTINLLSGSLALGSGTQSAGAFVSGAGFIDLTGSNFGTQVLDGTMTLSGSNLNMSTGTVTGEGNLLVRGNFNWGGGTISGSGIIDVNSTSTFSISTFSTSHTLSRTLNNAGVFNLSGGSISLSNGTITNLAGGTMNLSGTVNAVFNSLGGGTFNLINNAGQMNLGGGTSNLSLLGFNVNFLDSGTINVPSGTLLLDGGIYNTGAVITGGGFVDLTGSFTAVATLDDTLALNGSNVNLSTGTLTGPGNLVVNNAFSWTGQSTISGTGAINIMAGAVMNVSGFGIHTLSRTINNSGVLNILGVTSLSLTGGTVNNSAGGVINLSQASIYQGNTGSNLFSNDGQLNVLNSASLETIPLIDSGTISAASGTFTLGTTTFEAGAFLTGAGTMILSSNFGTQTVNGSTTLAGSKMQFNSGTLLGPGDINLTGVLNWNGGTIAGSGALNVAPSAVLNLSTIGNSPTLGRTINNSGTINIPNVTLFMAGGTINNSATGIVNASTGSGFVDFVSEGGVNRIVNAGTFNIPAGTVQFNVPFSNTGTFIVGGGLPAAAVFTTSVSQVVGSTLVRGAWIVHNNASLSFNSATITNNAAAVTLDGAGALFPNFNSIANNSGTFQITGGQTFVTSASYTNTGTTVVGTGSTLHIIGNLSSTGTLNVQGTLIVDGSSPAQILTQLASGRAGGAWNGTGIDSSAAAQNAQSNSPYQTALGFASASALGIASAGTIGGNPVNANSLVVRYTLLGDSNLDGVVNALDFNALATNFGTANAGWSGSDFNYDGIIDTMDFTAMATNFGGNIAAASPDLSPALRTLVPEPTAWLLVATSVLLLRRRSSRRRLSDVKYASPRV